ncbi:MAG: hypothetical protein BYD32DRAFT_429288 [Podila humilis]|nr:MAG: hypothetical protein BYD32DRAFT_429288 [Podila humilis]
MGHPLTFSLLSLSFSFPFCFVLFLFAVDVAATFPAVWPFCHRRQKIQSQLALLPRAINPWTLTDPIIHHQILFVQESHTRINYFFVVLCWCVFGVETNCPSSHHLFLFYHLITCLSSAHPLF